MIDDTTRDAGDPDGGNVRLPLLDPRALTAEQRALYDAIGAARGGQVPAGESGGLLGPFNAMLYSPRIGEPLQQLGAAIRFRTGFTARERELAILVVAAHLRADFEWYAHERIGRGSGLTDEELAALRAGRRPSLDDPRERVVHETARALAVDGDLDAAAFTAAVDALGRPLLVELVTLVGYYAALALQLRTFRVGVPPGAPAVAWDAP
ncbi:MAG TPA: carboxymuconolactone decarboxylase family protein [Streptosporangiaceae bacterium]